MTTTETTTERPCPHTDRALSQWPAKPGQHMSLPLAPQPFAAWLRAARLRRGWGLRTLAARTGLSRSFLSDLELGRSGPSARTRARLMAALGEGA